MLHEVEINKIKVGPLCGGSGLIPWAVSGLGVHPRILAIL